VGRQCPLPENFSILDLKMATSGAFWAQFVYSSGACFVLHGKQCFYVKLNPADELHYLQQRLRRNMQMPIQYWNSCFKDDHFVLFSACIAEGMNARIMHSACILKERMHDA